MSFKNRAPMNRDFFLNCSQLYLNLKLCTLLTKQPEYNKLRDLIFKCNDLGYKIMLQVVLGYVEFH